jgi:hypothetical protein
VKKIINYELYLEEGSSGLFADTLLELDLVLKTDQKFLLRIAGSLARI